MTDNEIINALTHCTMKGCTKCPLDTVKELGTGNCLELMLKEALDLINRQKAEVERLRTIRTPKKPTTHDEEYYFCPHCKEELSVTGEDMYIYDITPPKYCCHCGQALDWSDE